MLGRTAGPQPVAHVRLFDLPVIRSDDFDRLADDLIGRVAEQLRRSRVPTGDDSIVGQPENAVAGAIDDCGQPPTRGLRSLRSVMSIEEPMTATRAPSLPSIGVFVTNTHIFEPSRRVTS